MVRCILIERDGGKTARLYLIEGDSLCLAQNRSTKIAIATTPLDAAIELEQKNRPKESGALRASEVEVHVGTYHPAIARPQSVDSKELMLPDSDRDLEWMKSVWREVSVITQDLEQCFDVNTISEKNFDAFGSQYEKIIYFCCIGVESLFRRIFVANGSNKKHLTMNDFIILNPYLRLHEYSLSLVNYPWLPRLKPYEGWNAEHPSESLSWFLAYNSLKHDNRKNESLASMKAAIDACAAYYVLAYATFGGGFFPPWLGTQFYFHFEDRPKWSYSEIYVITPDKLWRPISLFEGCGAKNN